MEYSPQKSHYDNENHEDVHIICHGRKVSFFCNKLQTGNNTPSANTRLDTKCAHCEKMSLIEVD